MGIGEYSAIGFDFDKTIADVNPLHNEAWLSLLADLGIQATKKTFFVWPISKLKKYDNPINIANCLFRNSNIEPPTLLQIAESLRGILSRYKIENTSLTSEYECARTLCLLKERYLQRRIRTLSPSDVGGYLYPQVHFSLENIRHQMPDVFYYIVSSSSGTFIESFLEKVGLRQYFGLIIGEERLDYEEKTTVKAAESSKAALNALCDDFGSKPSLYVGDDEIRDYIFARNIGSQYVQVHTPPRFLHNIEFSDSFRELNRVVSRGTTRMNDMSAYYSITKEHKTPMLLSVSLLEHEKTGVPLQLDSSFIDVLHADFSDGSLMSEWKCDCVNSIIHWSKSQPEILLDLHFYSNDEQYILQKIRQVASTSKIRTVFVHIEKEEHLSLLNTVSNEGYLASPSLHYTANQNLINTLRNKAIERQDIIVLLPPMQDPDEKYYFLALPLLRKLRTTFPTARIGIDRDVDASRISAAAQLGVSHYILGKTLYTAPVPSELIPFLKIMHHGIVE